MKKGSKGRGQKEVQKKQPNGADTTTPSIVLDFEEDLMISILASAFSIKAKSQKSSNRLRRH